MTGIMELDAGLVAELSLSLIAGPLALLLSLSVGLLVEFSAVVGTAVVATSGVSVTSLV